MASKIRKLSVQSRNKVHFYVARNNDGNLNTSIDLETVKHYKSLAKRIQSIYNYVNFIFTFENPYKTRKNK